MNEKKFGVVVFPGSNCDEDMFHVLKHVMRQDTIKLWHKNRDLEGCTHIVLPGGFSYGDYLRSGAIARFSPIMDKVMIHAAQGGFLFGVCNGFQILCESGLLPGALLHNDNRKFICRNVLIKAEGKSAVTEKVNTSKPIKIPIAHGEGKFYADDATMKTIMENKQILFRYCDESANVTKESNPNGSLHNVAGICNKDRNVFGMMPHPERASDEDLHNIDGRAIFESILSS
jgi:phosphoribosylformylglycinamidine synthase I